jgi:hypothetical protein
MEGVVSFTPWVMCVSGVRREPGYSLGRRLGVLWCGSRKPGTHMRNDLPQFTCYEIQVRSTEHSLRKLCWTFDRNDTVVWIGLAVNGTTASDITRVRAVAKIAH